MSGLLAWWFSSCSQAQHSHVTFLWDTRRLFPVETNKKIVCGWLRDYKLFLITSETFFCFLRHALEKVLWLEGDTARLLNVCLNVSLKWEIRAQPCSCWRGVHITAVLMGTFVSNHGKMLRLTWTACTLEVQLQHCHVAKEETGSVKRSIHSGLKRPVFWLTS